MTITITVENLLLAILAGSFGAIFLNITYLTFFNVDKSQVQDNSWILPIPMLIALAYFIAVMFHP